MAFWGESLGVAFTGASGWLYNLVKEEKPRIDVALAGDYGYGSLKPGLVTP